MSQRIVVTSPWKLGLFVFLLVAGCGFGLVYTYLQYLGGSVDFEDPSQLRIFYGICGGVAFLGLIGYLSVVSAAQPIDRMVQGGKRRHKLLKQAANIDDATDIDPDDFEAEPQLMKIMERWRDDSALASQSDEFGMQQRHALSDLANQMREAEESGLELEGEDAEGSWGAVVHGINRLLRKANAAGDGAASPAVAVSSAQLGELHSTCTSSTVELRKHATGFAQIASTLQAASVSLSQSSGRSASIPSAEDLMLDSNLQGLCDKNKARIAGLRTQLEEMADRANKVAINSALQVSRLGEKAGHLLEAMDELRSISSNFQKLVGNLRLAENDQEITDGHIQNLMARVQRDWAKLAGGGQSADADAQRLAALNKVSERLQSFANGMAQQVGALETALGLDPVSGSISAVESPEQQLAQIHEELFSRPVAPVEAAVAAPEPEVENAPAADLTFEAPAVSARVETIPIDEAPELAPEMMAADEGEDEVYELDDFGAVPLAADAPGGADQDDKIYDLSEFGAVKL